MFQMGFIQLNEDFIFIEPLNDTVAITGHPHRVYRKKRSTEEHSRGKSAHYCGVIPGKSLKVLYLELHMVPPKSHQELPLSQE